ncbi:MAG TPA: hypothetical protein VJ625_01745 [Propionibacteriaceae bacterium]|nr:hypothetical protein [Propionibacteriaceae bacterium]
MSVSVLYMSMSLDGYIAGPNDELSNPFGDDGSGCTIGSSLKTVSSSGRQGRPESCSTNGMRHRRPHTSVTAYLTEPVDSQRLAL